MSSGNIEERNRIQAILKCQEASGREQLAEYLAYKTDKDVEAARKLLAAAAMAGQDKRAAAAAFHAKMAALGNPCVGADADRNAALYLQCTSINAEAIFAARKAAAAAHRDAGAAAFASSAPRLPGQGA